MEGSGKTLKSVFESFIGKEKTMDGKTFAKVAKDCKLIDKKLTATDIDLIFAKAKDKTERRITYAQFEKALELCAEKKGVEATAVKGSVTGSSGPEFSGTKAEANKFHDDPSLYTGVHAHGGPTTVDSVHPAASFGGPADQEEEKQASTKKAVKSEVVASASPAGSLEEVFKHFTGGAAEMEGKTFAKLAKDTKIIDKSLTATDVDLVFAKVKDKAARKITFAQFKTGVEEMAKKKKITAQALEEKILSIGGPVFSGTKAEANKFHDDKSLYTGVHANGGPSTVDAGNGMISDISQLCDRSDADVRGTKK